MCEVWEFKKQKIRKIQKPEFASPVQYLYIRCCVVRLLQWKYIGVGGSYDNTVEPRGESCDTLYVRVGRAGRVRGVLGRR